MPTPNLVAKALRDAADLIETKGWTQGAIARHEDGGETDADDPDAACFCVNGAMWAVTRQAPRDGTFSALYDTARSRLYHEICNEGYDMTEEWNDAPGRTAAEVIAKLRETAEKVESGNV